jgi:signal transduction histidine kinase
MADYNVLERSTGRQSSSTVKEMAELATSQDERHARRPLAAAARSLLIIEDDLDDQELYRRLIAENRSDDFVVTTTDSVMDGLALYQTLSPDCVLLDYNLPDYNGLEFLERLGRIRDSECLPVIMLTGLGNESVAVEAMKLGAQDYIAKRVLTPHLLRMAVKNAIEKIALRQRVKQLDRAKSDFLSIASHELRTPLTIIREYISLVRDGVTGPVTNVQADGLDTALNNCDRLGTLLNDILDLQRLESGAQRVHRVSIDLVELLARCVHDFTPVCQRRGQQCELQQSDNLPHVLCDPDAITQVVVNLISNAHKFAPDGSRILIRAAADKLNPALVRISVTDNGVGIRKEDQAQVFEKFTQFEQQSGPGSRGTGLGLAIVKNIVELHDGTIQLDSTPGVQTTFSFTLPAYSEYRHIASQVGDARRAAHSLNRELCVTLVKVLPDPLRRTGAPVQDRNVILASLEKEILRALRRTSDTIVILPSERTISITTEVEEIAAVDAVRQRISMAVSGGLTDRHTVQIASGVVQVNADIEEYLFVLRQELRTLDATHKMPTVLIIKHNKKVSEEIEATFGRAHFSLLVASAEDGYEGCLQFGNLEPDLVVIDAGSCDGNVEQVLSRLKTASSGRSVKTVLTSVGIEQQQKLAELGATAILVGQTEIPRIVEWVTRLLELKVAADEPGQVDANQ